MTSSSEKSSNTRLYFLDNLRTFLIFLVVLYHTGLIYESAGYAGMFWIVDDPVTSDLPGLINLFIDVFIMATLFFISGYLIPRSVQKNNSLQFIKSKFSRLIIPWLIAVFILIPIYKVIFLYSRGLPQEDWTTYFHFTNGIYGMNWLWYLPVLFFFHLLYLGISKMNLLRFKLSVPVAVSIVFALGFIYSMTCSITGFQGWTKTILFDFQNERLLIYFLFYLLGAYSYNNNLLKGKPKSNKLYYVANGVAWLPMMVYAITILNYFLNPGKYIVSESADLIILWSSFHMSLLTMVYIMIATFRRYFNKAGNFAAILNESSYGVYIIHTVIIGIVATLFLNVEMEAIGKYLIVTILSFIVSNLLVVLYNPIKSMIKSEGRQLSEGEVA